MFRHNIDELAPKKKEIIKSLLKLHIREMIKLTGFLK